jgi:hypothetical protein
MPCPFCQSQNHTLTRCDSPNLALLCQTAFDKFTEEFLADREDGTTTIGNWINSLRGFEVRGLTAKYKLQLNWNLENQKKTIILMHSLVLREIFQESISIVNFDLLTTMLYSGNIDRILIRNLKRETNDKIKWEQTKRSWRTTIYAAEGRQIINFYRFLRRSNQIQIFDVGTSTLVIRHCICDLSVHRYDLLFGQFLAVEETLHVAELMAGIANGSIAVRNPIPPKPVINIKIGIEQETHLEECPLCYETMDFEKNIKTNCSHEFCVDCMKRFLPTCSNRANCPMCRGQITEMVCHSDTSFNDVRPFVTIAV